MVQLPSLAVCSESGLLSLAAWAWIDSPRLLVVHPPPAESISVLRHTFLIVGVFLTGFGDLCVFRAWSVVWLLGAYMLARAK